MHFDHKQVAEFNAFIGDLRTKMDNFTSLWEKLVPQLGIDVGENFDEEGSAEGPWKPLNPQYAARKLKIWGPKPILEASRLMRTAATTRNAPGNVVDISPRRLFYGVDMTQAGMYVWPNGDTEPILVNYAGVHDAGRGGLPKREFFVLRKRDRRGMSVRQIVADHVRMEVRRSRQLYGTYYGGLKPGASGF
jgi:hypothetical protein